MVCGFTQGSGMISAISMLGFKLQNQLIVTSVKPRHNLRVESIIRGIRY